MQRLRVWLSLPCLLLFSVLAHGQATTGSISARVTDPGGRVVQGAAISVQNVDNGLTTTATTGSSGEFTLTALPPDNYKIIVEKTGFAVTTVPAFKLDIDQKARFNVGLRLDSATTTVEVNDLTPVLQVQGAETGQVIGAKEIQDLPTLGRDFTSLLLLVPGVVGGKGNNLAISVNGQREFANSFQINGVEVSGLNNDTNVRPSPDAIQEFKVVTSAYAPEFGRSAAGAVIIQTKSGTNQIHGSAFYFYRPTATAANGNFAAPGSSPTLTQHNYGVTIGGPLKHDKAFLFLAYEGYREKDSYSYVGQTLIGQDQVTYRPNGDVDLSKLLDPYTHKQVPIFNPYFYQANYYTQQYAGNIIPAAQVSPAGRQIVQKLFPAPGRNLTDPYGNFPLSVFLKHNSNVGNLRGDYTFSQNNRFYVTYDAQQGLTASTDPYAGSIPVAGGGGADTGDFTAFENHVVAATFDHVFTQNLLNETRATYFISPTTQKSLLDGSNLASQFGIQNANIPGFPSTFGFPQIFVGSGAATGGSTYKPLDARENILGLYDSLTYTRGKHNIKVGYEFRHINARSQYSLYPTPFEYFAGAGSSFTSDPYYTFYDANAYYYNGGAEIADLLLGLPQYALQGLQLTKPQTTSNEHTWYAQDYWQLTSKLNVTFGLRYEYVQPFVETSNNQSNLDLATLRINIAGRGSNSRSLVNSNTANYMPRVGVAYKLTPSTVLRGGYGLYYSPENDSRDILLTENYPFYTQQLLFNDPFNFAFKLDTGIARSTTIAVPAGTSSVDFTTVPGAANQVVNTQPSDFPTGSSKNYNFALQQQVGNSTSFEVAFVGATTRNLSYKVGDYNVNKRLSTKIGQVQALLPAGMSNYNSLQAKLTRRFTRGYSALVAYTWSHSLDNGPAPRNLGLGGDYPQNPFNLGAEYSNADADVRNNVVFSQIIELPVGHGKRFLSGASGITDALLGGWQINSITTLHGGRPFNIVSNSSNGLYPGLRPNLVGNPYVGHRSKSQWFNPAAFKIPTGQAASTGAGKTLITGNTPRNFLYGPGFTNEDVSLFKVLSLPREMKFQVRVEAFNVLNTARYGQPNGNATAIGTTAQPGAFGKITGAPAGVNQRVLQFGGRLIF